MGTVPNSAASVQQTTVLHEQEVCLRLHLDGHSIREVARRASLELGYDLNRTTAWRRIEAERQELRDTNREHAEKARDIAVMRMERQLARTTTMLEAATVREVDGETVLDVDAYVKLETLALRIEAERRKLLGLDAPVVAHIDVTHRNAVDTELAQMLADAGLTPDTIGTNHDATA